MKQLLFRRLACVAASVLAHAGCNGLKVIMGIYKNKMEMYKK